MSHVVSRAFNTRSRRFAPGMPVGPDDIDGPLSFETWCERGFIASPLQPDAEAVAPASPAGLETSPETAAAAAEIPPATHDQVAAEPAPQPDSPAPAESAAGDQPAA